MKLGVLTDSHLGNTEVDDDEIITVLKDIKKEFKARGVDTVLHLGDVIHEESREKDIQKHQEVSGIFDDFDSTYMLVGNHDIVELGNVKDVNLGWETAPPVIHETDDVVVLCVDTITQSEYTNIGYINEKHVDVVREKVSCPKETHIFSHFPLQATFEWSPAFDNYPEFAFPVNKFVFDEVFSQNNSTTYLYNGHLHPDGEVKTKGGPSDVPMTLIEPVLDFSAPPVEGSVNHGIDKNNLIFNF